MAKFVFITGGVVSGMGKGFAAASIGRLLKARGYKVNMLKMDPYFNIDSGKMSPLQHGEVFVTDDGAETDLSIGHYERIVGETMKESSVVTTGKVYYEVLSKERRGDYDGITVQVVPHITNCIKEKIYNAAKDADILIAEVGGTVGDIESRPFIEAIREVSVENGLHDTAFIHNTLVPYIPSSGELKSKPTQHSVKELLKIGVQPDILICRADRDIDDEMKAKIGLFCNMRPQDVIANTDSQSVYEIPVKLEKEGIIRSLCHHLRMEERPADLSAWEALAERAVHRSGNITVGVIGKYAEMKDTYHSLIEALQHSAIQKGIHVTVKMLSTAAVNFVGPRCACKDLDGIVAIGSYYEGDFEAHIKAAQYARTNNIPYFGIGLAMQAAAVEIARDLIGMSDAGSEEFGAKESIIKRNREGEQKITRKGAKVCRITPGSKAAAIYGTDTVLERHRCKFELDTGYERVFAGAGVVFGMTDEKGELVEELELKNHDFFVGVQFLPHFISRPNHPHPLFDAFVEQMI